jgi:hypothetical protein
MKPTGKSERGTRNGADRLRALNVPKHVEVELDANRQPAVVKMPDDVHAIEFVNEIWRLDDEWWRQSISRRYYEVVLEEGKHVVLFEDLVTGEWFLQTP